MRKSLPEQSPVWRAYQLYNNFKGRQSWDQVAVLYALSPSEGYWDLHSDGYCAVAEDGSNKWVAGKKKNQAYLTEEMDPREIAKVIDALMIGIYSSGY